MNSKKLVASPICWIFTGYFSMGLVSSSIGSVSSVVFKNLGMSNSTAALYASYFLLAYSVKSFFSPFLEMFKNKKYFVVLSQLALGVGFSMLALIMGLTNNVYVFVVFFFLLSFIGALQDVATDGMYVTSIESKQQAKFCGIQSLAWSVGPIVATGLLVSFSGYLYASVFKYDPAILGVKWLEAWRLIFFTLSIVMLLMAFLHWHLMPAAVYSEKKPSNFKEISYFWQDSFVNFFQKKDIWLMIFLVFSYRLSAGFLDKTTTFFLMDRREVGGLGLNNIDLGSILGTYGILSFLVGSLIGGWFVARQGLKSSLFMLCCCINIPNLVFVALAIFQPQNFWLINVLISAEKLLFGFGAVGHMIYMMQQLAPGKYTTAHYAFGTGLLSLCFVVTGGVSGYLQESLGYIKFFIFVMFAAIPSLIICWIAPFNNKGS